jgi:hypothetical protein
MEHQDSRENIDGLDDTRQPYEPPKATFVPLKLEERLYGCLMSPPPVGPCTLGSNM